MHRGGGPGEGPDDLGPDPVRRGRHRRRRTEEPRANDPRTGGEPRADARGGDARADARSEPRGESRGSEPRAGEPRTPDGPVPGATGPATHGPVQSAAQNPAQASGPAPSPAPGPAPSPVADESRLGRARARRAARARESGPVEGPATPGNGGGRLGVTYKYFGAPNSATAAQVPISMRPEELGGDELGMGGMFTKIKPETIAAMVLTGIQGMPLHKVPPLELVVLHPDYAVVKLPMTVVDPLRGIGEESVGAAAFIWSTVPDRGGPQDAFNVYQLLHEWQDFSHRLHEAGHQPYCLVWP